MNERKYVVDSLLYYLAFMPHYPWRVLRLDKIHGPRLRAAAISGRYSFPAYCGGPSSGSAPGLNPT